MGFLGNKMGIVFLVRFFVVFIFFLVSFFCSQIFVSDQRGVLVRGKVRFLVVFEGGHSVWPAAAPSPSPPFPLLLTHKYERDDKFQTKRTLITIAVSVGSGFVFCAIGVLLFLGRRKMRNQKRRKRWFTASSSVSSMLQRKVISDPVDKCGRENGRDSSDCSSGEIDEISISGVCESRIDVVADEDQEEPISSGDESFYSLNHSPSVIESSEIVVPKNQLEYAHSSPPPPPPPLPPATPGSSPPPPFRGNGSFPLPNLKPLNWDKAHAAPNVWNKLRSSSFEFDEEMIESLFKNDESVSANNTKAPSSSKHILDPKRLHDITILSKVLNATSGQVCAALIQGEGLSLQDLEALLKMAPTKEEAEKLEAFNGDMNELGSAEKLVKAMLKIPLAFSRIEAMFFREIFEEEVVHLRRSFSILDEACIELRSSRLFLKLLEAVLKTGKQMNIGTFRGESKAFKLDALLKLADVKGTDGKTTLLHFVVQEIIRSEGLRMSESIMGRIHQRASNEEDKEENYRKMGLEIVSSLSTELCNAKKTACLDLDVLAGSVANLSNRLNKIRALIILQDLEGFQRSMASFLKYAERKLNEVNEDEKRVLLHVRELTEYFHGDLVKDEANPLRIFVIARDFLNMLDQACKELRNSKVSRIFNTFSPF